MRHIYKDIFSFAQEKIMSQQNFLKFCKVKDKIDIKIAKYMANQLFNQLSQSNNNPKTTHVTVVKQNNSPTKWWAIY